MVRRWRIFMVALWNRAGHDAIVFLPCDFYLSSSFFFFIPRLFSEVGDWMSTILLQTTHDVALVWMSEMCCKRIDGNTGRKMTQKIAICAAAHHRTTLSGCIFFATKACVDNRKKLLNINIYIFMAALCNRGAIIFLPCSYGRPM